MNKVTFIEFDGTGREVEIENGGTVMEAATRNLVPGIDADCGGFAPVPLAMYTSTRLGWTNCPPISEDEDSMLEMVDDRDETSRLGCQIEMTPELNGLIVRTPESQH